MKLQLKLKNTCNVCKKNRLFLSSFSLSLAHQVFIRKTGGDDGFKDFHSDPEFRRVVFADDYSNGCPAGSPPPAAAGIPGDGLRSRAKKEPSPAVWKAPSDDSTRLGKFPAGKQFPVLEIFCSTILVTFVSIFLFGRKRLEGKRHK